MKDKISNQVVIGCNISRIPRGLQVCLCFERVATLLYYLREPSENCMIMLCVKCTYSTLLMFTSKTLNFTFLSFCSESSLNFQNFPLHVYVS